MKSKEKLEKFSVIFRCGPCGPAVKFYDDTTQILVHLKLLSV